ncbi:MAG: RNA methyltransferase [Candidatus Accumulibacter sp.]|jgi:TrmH family RNA methyltransferase|nr:RNA methyltransferase [Accumulibacter sp.]
MREITSRDNPRFKILKKLLESSRERRKTGRIFLEGLHLVESHVRRFDAPIEIFVCEKALRNPEIAAFLEGSDAGKEAVLLSSALFDSLAMLETPDGIMAIAARPVPKCEPDKTRDAVLLDGVQDSGNLGSIFRSTAAAGFNQVLLSADCARAWSPKTLRAGMGSHFQLDIHEDQCLSGFIEAYRGETILTALESETDLYLINLKGPLAWVFGNEGQGIRPALFKSVRRRVRIPMPGKIESLNVAAAAAICLFETLRQRRGNV